MSTTTTQTDAIMEQAQVFASAWSLAGGQFDSGDGHDEALAAKAELRRIVAAALAQPVAAEPAEDAQRLAWIHYYLTGTSTRGTIVNVLADHISYGAFIASVDAARATRPVP